MPLFCFCISKIVFSNRCDCRSVFPYVSGLSYRKGLLALRSANVDSVVVSRPLDVAVAFSQLPVQRSLSATFIVKNYNNSICRCTKNIHILWINRYCLSRRCDAETIASWEGCSKYHIRCVARRSLLQSAMASPSKVRDHMIDGAFVEWRTICYSSNDAVLFLEFYSNYDSFLNVLLRRLPYRYLYYYLIIFMLITNNPLLILHSMLISVSLPACLSVLTEWGNTR